jgi:hypothetical protein
MSAYACVGLLGLIGGQSGATAASKTAGQPASGASTTLAQAYTIDAGASVNVLTVTATASAGDIEVTIKNLLPVSITTYTLTIDVLQTQALPPVLPAPGGTVTTGGTPSCSDVITQYQNDLQAARSEQQVAQVGVKFNSLGDSCTSKADKAAAQSAVTQFQDATTATLPNKITLAAGERVVLTLTRKASDKVPAQQIGRYTISTAPIASQWLVFYGANFINSADEQFYANINKGTSPATYTVTPQANRSNRQFAPSVNFMWLPAENFICDKSHVFSGCLGRAFAWRSGSSDIFGGLSAGLGFGTNGGTSNPVAFLGYGVGWGYNVVLTAGVAMHQEQRLVGQYNSGQVITENLTPAQLSQSVYTPRFFVGLLFRFGSNPFGSKSASPSTTKTTTPGSGTGQTPTAGQTPVAGQTSAPH